MYFGVESNNAYRLHVLIAQKHNTPNKTALCLGMIRWQLISSCQISCRVSSCCNARLAHTHRPGRVDSSSYVEGTCYKSPPKKHVMSKKDEMCAEMSNQHGSLFSTVAPAAIDSKKASRAVFFISISHRVSAGRPRFQFSISATIHLTYIDIYLKIWHSNTNLQVSWRWKEQLRFPSLQLRT